MRLPSGEYLAWKALLVDGMRFTDSPTCLSLRETRQILSTPNIWEYTSRYPCCEMLMSTGSSPVTVNLTGLPVGFGCVRHNSNLPPRIEENTSARPFGV